MNSIVINKVFTCPSEIQAPDSFAIANSVCQYTATFALESGTSATAATGTNGNGPRSLASIDHPSQTIAITEGKVPGTGTSASGAYGCNSSTTYTKVTADLAQPTPSATTSIRFRHKDSMNALYLDGHVGAIAWADLKSAKTSITSANWAGKGY